MSDMLNVRLEQLSSVLKIPTEDADFRLLDRNDKEMESVKYSAAWFERWERENMDRMLKMENFHNNYYQMNPRLRDFWETKSRNKILRGGRASSKSHDAAGNAVRLTSNYPLRFVCARRFQANIQESVYELVKNKILESPFLKDWKIYKRSLFNKRTGSEFLFYGIERNLTEIKSTEGIDVLWLEEAQYITKDQWMVLEPTIRKNDTEIWAVFNPDQIDDFIYDNFVVNERPDTLVREINWEDNPWLSVTMYKIIKDLYLTDRKLAMHVYGGVVNTGSDLSVINGDYIDAAIDAHKIIPEWDFSGMARLGFDIADDGEDNCAAALTVGNIIHYIEEWHALEDELLKSSTRVYNLAKKSNAHIVFDSIGVGAHAGSKFKELNEDAIKNKVKFVANYSAFNAKGSVEDPKGIYMKLPHMDILNVDHFENIKAQKWDDLAVKFRKTYERVRMGVMHPISELISINTDLIPPAMIKQIRKELSAPRKSTSGRGKFMVEDKESLRKRGIKSPNVADAIVMSTIIPPRKPTSFFDI